MPGWVWSAGDVRDRLGLRPRSMRPCGFSRTTRTACGS
ncbi:hypothetical protein BN2537_17041 [Streptomyces venezuelae]|nr:hypothetical protein BN2537_17041 [Streptomyces venezuelae]